MLNDDSKRMILLGHVGRMRNAAPDVRRIAIQSISKVAGPSELHKLNLSPANPWRGLPPLVHLCVCVCTYIHAHAHAHTTHTHTH